jgi:hypothetical protein
MGTKNYVNLNNQQVQIVIAVRIVREKDISHISTVSFNVINDCS